MTHYESPYLKEISLFRNLQQGCKKVPKRLHSTCHSLLLTRKLGLANLSGMVLSPPSKSQAYRQLQQKMAQMDEQSTAELNQLRKVDKELSEQLGRLTHDAYISRLELLEIKRYMAELMEEYEAEEQAYKDTLGDYDDDDQDEDNQAEADEEEYNQSYGDEDDDEDEAQSKEQQGQEGQAGYTGEGDQTGRAANCSDIYQSM